MNVILFDDSEIRTSLRPLTDTRPVGEIRTGVFTIKEKWERYFNTSISYLTQEYLQRKFPLEEDQDNLLINGAVLPNPVLLEAIQALLPGQALVKDNVIALRYSGTQGRKLLLKKILTDFEPVPYKAKVKAIEHLYDIFLFNGNEIKKDVELIKKRRLSHEIKDKHTIIYKKSGVFIEEGVQVRAAILNASKGPIYLGKNAEVMEGACIHGPFALGEGARVNMGALISGDTTVGPYCKVGGEVHNSVFLGYSNKGHAGFVGNSVIGEWCNLGADTNTSNLKNNYSSIKLWNYLYEQPTETNLQFCGLMMGDHSKSSINTMFNTGTVMGTCANVFGTGFPDKFIPAFSWGDSNTTFKLEKAYEVAEKVMARRQITFSEEDKLIFKHIYEASKKFRSH